MPRLDAEFRTPSAFRYGLLPKLRAPYTGTFNLHLTGETIAMATKKEEEFHSPQTEAALFFGLFLRGHSADALRAEIDIPPKVLKKWMRAREYDADFRAQLHQMYVYRKRVLAIFDSLVMNSETQSAWQ